VGKWIWYGQVIKPTVEFRSTTPTGASVASGRARRLEAAVALALTLLLGVLWTLMHPYQGLALDAQLYAVQALAKLHPALGTDLYLQNVSQDKYTIFSSLYTFLIGFLGLQNAALLLILSCTACFFAAAWSLGRDLSNRDTAWLTVAMLMVTGGAYGAAHVFHFSEGYLTARTVAETLVVIALACHFRGLKISGLAIATAALLFHPIMALPGLLLLVCLWLPIRASVIGAVAGIVVALGIAVAPHVVPAAGRLITIMDADWLGIVRERAQFLFLQLWTVKDWELNVRPFTCLAFTLAAVQDERLRKLSVGALLVGAAGLAVAYIAGSVGPAAILLQGQAWRWVWITGLIGVLLLAPTLRWVWRDEKCGPICVVLLISAWTFEPVDSLLCTIVPLILWLTRSYISIRMARCLKWTALAIGVALLAWVIASSWKIVSAPLAESGLEPIVLQRVRYIFELDISAVLFVWILWSWIRRSRILWVPTVVSLVLLASLVLILPSSFRQISRVGSVADILEFADWETRIPPASTVFVAPAKDAGAFVWFTLGRPNYLSSSQSAGVVFSRETALEVRRRSEVLLPVADPDWKILTRLSRAWTDKRQKASAFHPLTRKSLVSICGDPRLGFVISPENVGFDPLRHTHAGVWKDWNLYDCSRVRGSDTAS